MNLENENIEPTTDLQLALGYPNNNIQRRLSNDLGAGANAASRIDMTFVTTDPLSELVWSPQKGPSLRCTDCSFTDKKHSLGWGAGPSNAVLSPQPLNTSMRSSSDKPIDEENFNTCVAAFDSMDTKVANIDDSDKSARDIDGISQVAEQAVATEKKFPISPDEIKPDVPHIESLFNDPADEARDGNSGTPMSKMEMVLPSEVHSENKGDAHAPRENNLTSAGGRPQESASSVEKRGKRKMKGVISLSLWPLEKLEATAENDFQTPIGDNVHVATSKISGSESSSEVEKCCKHQKEILPEKMSADKHSPTNSGIRRYRRKGKEKALSDGDVKGMMSKEEDDSHESVESCNSAGLFSTGKKRGGFEQQLIVGSKRVKKQIGENPSSSLVKQDSSFMNWISNMMKGFLNSKDENPSLALTVANPNQSHEIPDKSLDADDTNQDPGCRNIGFQSFFQSIYSPKSKVQGTTQNENFQAGLENKICDTDATPISCHGENFSFHKMFLLSNERFKEPTSCARAGASNEPKISLMNLSPSKRSSEGEYNSAENKNSCNLAVGVEKDRASSSSSLGKRKAINNEHIDSDPPSEGKTVHNSGYKSNLLGSLWITRFTPKVSCSLLNQDTSGPVESSSDCMKLIPCSKNNVNLAQQSAEEPLTSSGKELPNSATDIEASISFNKVTVQDDQKAKFKMSPFFSSPRLKDSEAMASLFSRRLDALKHIMRSGVSDTPASSALCFFCGRKGHHLQYCPEVTDNEIEDLLRNMKSSNRLEELPCVCIRCFELDHWAVSCPKTSSRGQHQSSLRASSANLGDVIDTGKGSSNDYGVTADKVRSNIDLNKKHVASSSKENELKENQITPWGNFFAQKFSDMPKAIFNAVRMLRFSRTDILKWMNSKTPLSHLEGFFLRLRLGKWEEGLGGTGYYVACITGAHRQSTQQTSKSSISVNVGGVKCLVESQYISNHDFLEDELIAWWRATTRSGGKIPSEQELSMKVKERRMLGF
ncbi:Zinc finger, CCHC-type [Corchorus capsularis]|uniref:Zinc finger, CCHC-type n=1 Tax=Corchorus capsularis TaxID=210143 RepID=A0A1R3G9P0_COCAP|nr:Zinc finger, CCHC-type [Corchorus capsularis]